LRNPNYFGELLIYLGFVAIPMHWLPLTALAVMVLGYWVPNMIAKDKSLSRHPGFAAYKARSWRFIPLVW
jgi:steroid 5-alpha reductase family enzyme